MTPISPIPPDPSDELAGIRPAWLRVFSCLFFLAVIWTAVATRFTRKPSLNRSLAEDESRKIRRSLEHRLDSDPRTRSLR